MTTPPYDSNNPYDNSGQGGGYPSNPGGSGGGYPSYPGGAGGGYPGGPGGYPGGYMPAGQPPPNHLAFAIVVTILCCWPLGIPAIIYANQVNTKWNAGDFEGARHSSERAKNFSIWSMVSVLIIYGVIAILGFMGAFANA